MRPSTASRHAKFDSPFQVSKRDAMVLEVILENPSCTKNDLADISGLTYAAITSSLNSLIDQGIVSKLEKSEFTGGRRSILYGLNSDAGLMLGADIGTTSIDLIITDYSGHTLARFAEPAQVSDGPAVILDRVLTLFLDLIETNGLTGQRILGLGMGLPGPVDFNSGQAVSPPIMPGWDKFPVRRYIGERLPGVMVVIDNDVNIIGIGEHRAGRGAGIDNFILVKIGTGIGAAVFIDRKIYRGADGCAGDIGHICVDKAGPVCTCGNHGCLESIAGGGALALQARKAAVEGKSQILKQMYDQKDGNLQAEDIGIAAREGDLYSLGIIKQTGRYIGDVLAGLVNFANPNMIIIGGGVSNFGNHLLSNIRQAILERSLPLATHRLSIVFSSLQNDAGVIGAITLVQKYSFSTLDS